MKKLKKCILLFLQPRLFSANWNIYNIRNRSGWNGEAWKWNFDVFMKHTHTHESGWGGFALPQEIDFFDQNEKIT